MIRAGIIPEQYRYMFANKPYAYSQPILPESASRDEAYQKLRGAVGQKFKREVYDKIGRYDPILAKAEQFLKALFARYDKNNKLLPHKDWYEAETVSAFFPPMNELQHLRNREEFPDDYNRVYRKLEQLMSEFEEGVTLSCTEQPIDTSTSAEKAFLDMLGVFAEFETNLRKERQAEGIAKARSKGVYKGRKPTIDAEAIKELADTGLGATAIARQMGINRATVYRALT